MTEIETYRMALLGLRALKVKGLVAGSYLMRGRNPQTEACLCVAGATDVTLGLLASGATEAQTFEDIARAMNVENDRVGLERTIGVNDGFRRGDNSPEACAERYRVVRAHVEQRLAELEAAEAGS